jgi:hypothetical protein
VVAGGGQTPLRNINQTLISIANLNESADAIEKVQEAQNE